MAQIAQRMHAVCTPQTDQAAQATADAFRQGMRRLAGAVCIVAAGAEGERGGLTATTVCSVSADPPRLLVCVNRSAGAHALIAGEQRLSVNVLRADQRLLADRFASPGIKGEARFAEGAWRQWHGVPVLADAAVHFACRVHQQLETGTHTIFICDLLGCLHGEPVDCLLYLDGRFRKLAAGEDAACAH